MVSMLMSGLVLFSFIKYGRLSDGAIFVLYVSQFVLALDLGVGAHVNKLRKSSRCFLGAAGIFFVLAVFQGISLLLP